MNQPIPLKLDSPGQGSPVELGVPRQICRLSQVAAVLIVAVTLPQAMGVVASWQAYGRLDTLHVGPLQTRFVSSADGLALVATLSVVLMVAATVSLLMWVWRARCNAELIAPSHHFRFSRGFAVGAWLVPIANIWWSRAVLDEIWSASRPSSGDETDRRGPLILGWWLCVLAYTVLRVVSPFAYDRVTIIRHDPTGGVQGLDEARQAFLTVSLLNSLSLALMVLGTLLLAAAILRISRWQTDLTSDRQNGSQIEIPSSKSV
ncbi:MAG TPA: DUF4328 domain-containing protein [Pseudonocardia sp.]|uniref:DUF4328 domain-containing protein n=1 Tax=Pseudonocardia sp. TaxID=60912 RepID=UPI002BE25F36|nr:DUF4328 domain-containing protein [Pseudonocardia sp.]HTF49902.1 DUF4328 domain-containing protein [Pseudonocardia sp.]